jgi:hypothetical protein
MNAESFGLHRCGWSAATGKYLGRSKTGIDRAMLVAE